MGVGLMLRIASRYGLRVAGALIAARRRLVRASASRPDGDAMIPGECFVDDGEIELNVGRDA